MLHQTEATLGRTEENEVALDATGVSRRHARIRFQAGRYYAEDLGSQNGTFVNGVRLEGPRALVTGDRLLIGTVVLEYHGPDSGEEIQTEIPTDPAREREPSGRVEPAAPQRTSNPQPRPPPGRSSNPQARASSNPQARAAEPPGGSNPQVRAAEPRGGSNPQARPPLPGPPRPEVLAPLPQRREEPGPTPLPPPRPVLQSAGLLQAVVRSRRRREASAHSPLARLRRLLPSRPHWRGAFVAALLTALGAAALWLFPRPGVSSRPRVEPEVIGPVPLEGSFGLGPGVSWKVEEGKSFHFELRGPGRSVGLLHYRAMDISSGEVSIALNGKPLGEVPPDARDPETRALGLVLPPDVLRPGRNELRFQHARALPEGGAWRIWELALEVLPLPPLRPDELLERARQKAAGGEKLLDARAEASENLFEAWRAYRAAWLALEAMDPKPELYTVVRQRLELLDRELDSRCGVLLRKARQAIERRQPQEAREALGEVFRYFPGTEHRCHNLALREREQYGLQEL